MSTAIQILQWLAADVQWPRWAFGVMFFVTFCVTWLLVILAVLGFFRFVWTEQEREESP